MRSTTCSQTSSVDCLIQRGGWTQKTSIPSWSECVSLCVFVYHHLLCLSSKWFIRPTLALGRLGINRDFGLKNLLIPFLFLRFRQLCAWGGCWMKWQSCVLIPLCVCVFQAAFLIHHQRETDWVSGGETVSALQDCQVSNTSLSWPPTCPFTSLHLHFYDLLSFSL